MARGNREPFERSRRRCPFRARHEREPQAHRRIWLCVARASSAFRARIYARLLRFARHPTLNSYSPTTSGDIVKEDSPVYP